jgi:hypothetical protein
VCVEKRNEQEDKEAEMKKKWKEEGRQLKTIFFFQG